MNTEKPTKRYRGGCQVNWLLRRISWLYPSDAAKPKVLSEAASSARFYLDCRAKVQREPKQSLAAAVIVVALQSKILTRDEWENGLRYIYSDAPARDAAIDNLFERIMGRRPDRSSTAKIQAEATLIWACVKLPYSENQLQYLAKVYLHYRDKKYKDMTREERQRLYHKPPCFEEDVTREPVDSDDGHGSDNFRSSLREFLDRRDEDGGGRYGYMPGTREGASKPKQQPKPALVNPEDIAHADQAHIDEVAGELLADVDF